MTNKQYCTEILNIIGDVSIAADAIYQLGFDVYRKLGGQEDKPTIDTIYKELKQAISIWDNTNNLTITENGTYSILGKTIDVSVGGSVVIGDTLKFTSTGNSTIRLANTGNNAPDMQYSLDNKQTWVLWDYSSISLADGETVYFKGNNPNGFSSEYKYSTFTMAGSLAASGNIMSLIDNGACNTLTIPNDYCFKDLFNGCSSLTTAPELPATTLANRCYYMMFTGCSNLTSAPVLPATTLANFCYQGMFWSCTGLTSAPVLPATTLANGCYHHMFKNCSSLTSAPVLPATTLAKSCYYCMFWGCTGLTSAPELPATTLANGCYYYMFRECSRLNYIKCLATSGINTNNSTTDWVYGVASSGTFIKDSNTTWPTGSDGIRIGWTVVNN